MPKKILLMATGFLLLISLSPSPLGERRQEKAVAFVDVDRIVHAHPRFREVIRIEREIQTLEAEYLRRAGGGDLGRDELLQSYRSLETSLALYGEKLKAVSAAFSTTEGETRRRVEEEVEEELRYLREERLEDKRRELISAAEKEIEAARERAQEEIESVKKEIGDAYLPELFEIKLKLELLDLSEEERERLLERSASLQRERDSALDERISSIEGALKEASHMVMARVEEEMETYTLILDEELQKLRENKREGIEEKAREWQDRVRTSLAVRLDEQEMRLHRFAGENALDRVKASEGDEEPADLRKRLNELEAEKADILIEIASDVRETILSLEKERGLSIFLSPAGDFFKGEIDFTWQVLGTIVKRYRRGGG